MQENKNGNIGQVSDSRLMEFKLGHESFALPLLAVREVIALANVTPIPQSPPYFLGIMNLRGLIVSIVDLRKKIGVPAATTAENAVVICALGGVSIGFLVDSVVAVLSPEAEDLSDASDIQGIKRGDFLSGVYRQKDRIVLLIEPTKLMNVSDQQFVKNLNQKAA
ncbi:MAG: chemotaxis protein CheW [Bacteriovoracia bacterium]